MSSTKVMYVIKHGISVCVKKVLIKEISDRPFAYNFNVFQPE